ncbi:MAG: META domain-containing protein [Chloroflexi bacterium]|nr:META domain-containing protein [Chloroflexota bacterium]
MRYRIFFTLLFALLAALPVAVFAQQAADDLAGTRWLLVSIAGEEVLEAARVTLDFGAASSAGGSSGCNFYGGSYTLGVNGAIAFTDLVSTMMACLDSRVMEQESAYLTALQAATAYAIVDGQLVITYGSGDTLVFDPAPALPGTQWQLAAFGAEPVVAGSEISLEFDAAGNAMGVGGCNPYGGAYTIDGDTLSFAEIVRTEMACLDESLMQQEDAYLTALAAATGYHIEDDLLTIRYGANGETLIFQRVIAVAGTAWQLESIDETPVSSAITLQFDAANGVSGSGGCNQYSSSYTLTGTAIRFEVVVSTRMACAEALMQQEGAYFAALEAAERIDLRGERLTIATSDGQTLTFVPAGTVRSGSN